MQQILKWLLPSSKQEHQFPLIRVASIHINTSYYSSRILESTFVKIPCISTKNILLSLKKPLKGILALIQLTEDL